MIKCYSKPNKVYSIHSMRDDETASLFQYQRRSVQRTDDSSVLLIEHCDQDTMKQYMTKCLEILNQSLLLTVEDYEEYTGYMDRVSSVYGLLFSNVQSLLLDNEFSVPALDIDYDTQGTWSHVHYLAVGLAQNIISYSYMFNEKPRVICGRYLEHARYHWSRVAGRRGVDSNREVRCCPLPSFDIQDNLVWLYLNDNGIIEGEFPHEEISVYYDTD